MPAAVVAAGITAAAGVGSAVIGSKAAKKAAKAQTQSVDAGIAYQRERDAQQREDLAPWRQVGGQAVQDAYAMTRPGYNYQATDPSYAWRFNEGQRALQGSAAAKGGLLSGGTLKDLMGYGQGLASTEYGNSFNRLSTLAGLGSASAMGGAQLGQQSANNIGNLLTQGGNARASGYIGSANAIGQGLGSLASIATYPGLFGSGGGVPFNPYTIQSLQPYSQQLIANNPGVF